MSNLDNIEKLKKLSKADAGFKTPDSYFNGFEDRIEAQIAIAEEPKKSVPAQIIQLMKPVLALAACFVFVMLILRYPAKMISEHVNNAPVSETEMLRMESDMLNDDYLAEMIIASDEAFTATEEHALSDDDISELTQHVNDYDTLLALQNE